MPTPLVKRIKRQLIRQRRCVQSLISDHFVTNVPVRQDGFDYPNHRPSREYGGTTLPFSTQPSKQLPVQCRLARAEGRALRLMRAESRINLASDDVRPREADISDGCVAERTNCSLGWPAKSTAIRSHHGAARICVQAGKRRVPCGKDLSATPK